jgi:hypothetical protein
MKRFRLVAFTVGSVLNVYVAGFVSRFDVLSAPVQNERYGWLGPHIRGDTHWVDIGKVLYYESDDVSPYRGV